MTGVFAIIQFYPSWTTPVAAILIMVVVQQIMGNLIEPGLLGDLLNLSPVVIIFSLLIWGWLWGIVGMFLAVPITVALKIVCENIPALNSIAILMGTGQVKHAPGSPKKKS
jgi:predicted PurR-regulated permease PerM